MKGTSKQILRKWHSLNIPEIVEAEIQRQQKKLDDWMFGDIARERIAGLTKFLSWFEENGIPSDWQRYEDDTFVYHGPGIMEIINGFLDDFTGSAGHRGLCLAWLADLANHGDFLREE